MNVSEASLICLGLIFVAIGISTVFGERIYSALGLILIAWAILSILDEKGRGLT